MRQVLPTLGWLVAALYFGVIVVFNVAIGRELLRLPSGFEPGWWPLIEADALYVGLGLIVVLLVSLAWRRLSASRSSALLPS